MRSQALHTRTRMVQLRRSGLTLGLVILVATAGSASRGEEHLAHGECARGAY